MFCFAFFFALKRFFVAHLKCKRNVGTVTQQCLQRVRGGEPEGVRKHLLSKKVVLCSKKGFIRRSQRGGKWGRVAAPKFCGFGLEFSQMFWAGGAFYVAWALQHQSENPSCSER